MVHRGSKPCHIPWQCPEAGAAAQGPSHHRMRGLYQSTLAACMPEYCSSSWWAHILPESMQPALSLVTLKAHASKRLVQPAVSQPPRNSLCSCWWLQPLPRRTAAAGVAAQGPPSSSLSPFVPSASLTSVTALAICDGQLPEPLAMMTRCMRCKLQAGQHSATARLHLFSSTSGMRRWQALYKWLLPAQPVCQHQAWLARQGR